MAPDDDLVQHLRALARDVPGIALDPASVLRAGRRHRRARTAAGLGAVAAVASGAVLAVAAVAAPGPQPVAGDPTPQVTSSPGPSAAPPVPERAAAAAWVDESTGLVVLPLDALTWGPTDETIHMTALDLYVGRCMTAAGYGEGVQFHDLSESGRLGWDLAWGPWTRAQVDAGAYDTMTAPVDPMSVNPIPVDGEAEAAASRGCYQGAEDAGLSFDPGELGASAPQGYTFVDTTAEGQAIHEEWATCLAQDGIDADDWLPRGATADDAEQARVAALDVACKQRHDTVRRLAALQGRLQLEFIARAEDYLAARHAVETRVREATEAYLRAGGTEPALPHVVARLDEIVEAEAAREAARASAEVLTVP